MFIIIDVTLVWNDIGWIIIWWFLYNYIYHRKECFLPNTDKASSYYIAILRNYFISLISKWTVHCSLWNDNLSLYPIGKGSLTVEHPSNAFKLYYEETVHDNKIYLTYCRLSCSHYQHANNHYKTKPLTNILLTYWALVSRIRLVEHRSLREGEYCRFHWSILFCDWKRRTCSLCKYGWVQLMCFIKLNSASFDKDVCSTIECIDTESNITGNVLNWE